MPHESGSSRRAFLASLVTGVAVAPLLRMSSLQAADLPHLSPDDAAAKPLHYTENAAQAKGDSMYQAGRRCGSCALYSGAATGYGPCAAFPGKAVNVDGWCHAWTAKT